MQPKAAPPWPRIPVSFNDSLAGTGAVACTAAARLTHRAALSEDDSACRWGAQRTRGLARAQRHHQPAYVRLVGDTHVDWSIPRRTHGELRVRRAHTTVELRAKPSCAVGALVPGKRIRRPAGPA